MYSYELLLLLLA